MVEGYLLTAAHPDLERGIAPLGPPVPAQPPLLGGRVPPPGRHPWPQMQGSSSQPPPLTPYFNQSKHREVAHVVKSLPAMQETWIQSLSWEDHLEEGMATHSRILA